MEVVVGIVALVAGDVPGPLASAGLVVAFVGVAAWGVCTALLSGPSRTLLQRNAPEAVHGRVIATDTMSGTAAQLLGIVSTGVLIGAVGVPAAMSLLGDRAWWLPKSLDRILPSIDLEGTSHAGPAGASQPAAVEEREPEEEVDREPALV